MATVKDIYELINWLAPFSEAEDWDNSGLLVGDGNRKVNRILFALDITSDVIKQAAEQGADLIITHHPVIFKPISSVLSDSLVYKLIKNDLSIICAHTNYDKAQGGVNDILCRAVGLTDVAHCEGLCLNTGYLRERMPIENFARKIKNVLGGEVRYNNRDGAVRKIAVCSGSGSDYLKTAYELGCDALLTGDGSHHAFLDAQEYGISLVCAGHFETENIAINELLNKIRGRFEIDCILAEQTTPIITV